MSHSQTQSPVYAHGVGVCVAEMNVREPLVLKEFDSAIGLAATGERVRTRQPASQVMLRILGLHRDVLPGG